jgi:hypothetical protein
VSVCRCSMVNLRVEERLGVGLGTNDMEFESSPSSSRVESESESESSQLPRHCWESLQNNENVDVGTPI